uniref:Uncharacterized protein n=1 Tax=Physcomitrium patens TaxID=3218 RepID=A0A2K1JMB3_PHYPA|nr:hypothetical protein PHYPA_017503 [Physcomitrium patens]
MMQDRAIRTWDFLLVPAFLTDFVTFIGGFHAAGIWIHRLESGNWGWFIN